MAWQDLALADRHVAVDHLAHERMDEAERALERRISARASAPMAAAARGSSMPARAATVGQLGVLAQHRDGLRRRDRIRRAAARAAAGWSARSPRGPPRARGRHWRRRAGRRRRPGSAGAGRAAAGCPRWPRGRRRGTPGRARCAEARRDQRARRPVAQRPGADERGGGLLDDLGRPARGRRPARPSAGPPRAAPAGPRGGASGTPGSAATGVSTQWRSSTTSDERALAGGVGGEPEQAVQRGERGVAAVAVARGREHGAGRAGRARQPALAAARRR